MSARVYLASRFARGAELEGLAQEARAVGVEVTSRWHNGSHGDPQGDWDVNDPAMPGYAADDIADLAAADTVVSFTEGGGGKGGRHVEFGLGLAHGKRMLIVGPREHVFHTADGVEQFDTWALALCAIMDAPLPPVEKRYFLGVTDSGLQIGTVLTGRFRGAPRPIPMSALRGDMADLTRSDVFDRLLTGDGSPLLWPVSAEVYAAVNSADLLDALDGDGDDDDDEDDEPESVGEL